MSVPQTQEFLGGIGRTQIYKLASQGRLHIVKVGRRTFFREDAVIAFIESLNTGPADTATQ